MALKTLYLSDIDGTLARAGYDLREDTAQMMKQITRREIPFAVATGRYVSKALPVISQAGIMLPALVLNGAMIFDPVKGEAIKTWPIGWEEAKQLIRRVEAVGANVRVIHHRPWEQRCVLYTNEVTPHGGSLTLRNHQGLLYDEQFIFPAIADMLEAQGQQGEILYVGTSGPRELVDKATQATQLVPGISPFRHQSPHQAEKWFLDIVAATSGKGVAALWLKEYLQAQTLVTLGDNENDKPLLQAGDIACTVPEAPEGVKALADVVLPGGINCVPQYVMEREGILATPASE